MPEGHILHRLAREITYRFADGMRVSSPQGRFAAEAAAVDGTPFVGADAYGKHLFVGFDTDLWIHIHLGLIGKMTFAAPHPPVGEVRLRLADEHTVADLRGPQTCRLIASAERDRQLARLGPDPLRADADPELAWRTIRGSTKPIAALLMDQAVLAGAGNIYRAEVLFRAHTDPMLPGNQLPIATWKAIWVDLANLMAAGVHTGRIDTVRREHTPESMGRPARVDDHGGEVYVYRRAGEPCLVCQTPVRSATLAGRNLYWCPRCQVSR